MSKYGYPSNIDEAARILDGAMPHWYRNINLATLNMKLPKWCILGQLYGSWSTGMTTLFGSETPDGIHYRDNDNIFGVAATLQDWGAEITKRKGLSVRDNPPTIQVNRKTVISVILSYGGVSIEIPSEDIDFIIGKLQQAKGFTHVP